MKDGRRGKKAHVEWM
jgi:hypothetical protein